MTDVLPQCDECCCPEGGFFFTPSRTFTAICHRKHKLIGRMEVGNEWITLNRSWLFSERRFETGGGGGRKKENFLGIQHHPEMTYRYGHFLQWVNGGGLQPIESKRGLGYNLSLPFSLSLAPPLLLSSSSARGSGQSVAFDYQSPAAPLLAPWHEHHIRRSDLHRNVSVSIVVSKFTIYRHSRRSPVSETLLWSSRLSAFIFLRSLLLLAYSISCCCWSDFLVFFFSFFSSLRISSPAVGERWNYTWTLRSATRLSFAAGRDDEVDLTT